ncbi:MBL fold metallo-hydrolase [Niabella yanshanensis]|uniref:MBL fold metallo-hydrolase n=1 Tax=Niabella yanshanensis TaxID=577386 RepID=A0ABZ0WA43_9BACT|nr:MBL fold metallo-hydrolase [Niabella yanshanensis]WQD40158.1 MBL fold metallo-hydrolase [Niabella yanshanensis]
MPVQSVTDILLTHWHNDHSAGTAELKAISNCTIYCQNEEAPYFEKKPNSKIRQLAEYIPERGILVLFKGLLGEVVPRNVKIDQLLSDGDTILNDFIVLESPGHTPGHISFYDKKSGTLFAGDALAVIQQKLRLMAGVVTPDKPASITSILKLFKDRDINIICPGHREPLIENTKPEIARFIRYIQEMKRWPLLG